MRSVFLEVMFVVASFIVMGRFMYLMHRGGHARILERHGFAENKDG